MGPGLVVIAGLRWLIHPAAPHPTPAGLTAYLLIDVAIIVALARTLGLLANRLRQPRAVGEIVAGILIGPTVIGRDLSGFVFPAGARASLGAIATLALVLFMFVVGLEFDASAVRGRERLAWGAGLLSVAVPAAFGFAVAAAIHDRRLAGPSGAHLLAFALFIGASLAVTALPVIAHLLLERGELNDRAAAVGLAGSAVCSVAVFLYVALASNVIDGKGYAQFFLRLGLIVGAGLVARFVGRPWIRVLLRRSRSGEAELSTGGMAAVFVGLFLSAFVADRLGISALVGAFVWGLLMPADRRLRAHLSESLRGVATVVLLPVFFAYAGLSADLRLLTPGLLPALGLLLVAAVVSKFLAAAPLRAAGMSWRDAGVVGTLMNTRGLVLLVVGLIGLDLRVITASAYTILVVVALLTNMMAGPLLDALRATADRTAPADMAAELVTT